MSEVTQEDVRRIRATQIATIQLIERLAANLTQRGALLPNDAAFELSMVRILVTDQDVRNHWDQAHARLCEVRPDPAPAIAAEG